MPRPGAHVVLRAESPAEDRLDAHHAEEAGGRVDPVDPLIAVAHGYVEVMARTAPVEQHAEIVEHPGPLPPVREVGRRHAPGSGTMCEVALPQRHDAIGI